MKKHPACARSEVQMVSSTLICRKSSHKEVQEVQARSDHPKEQPESSWRVLTPANITGSTSSNWATHSVIGGKDKSEYTGPGLKSYQFEIQLVSKLGVNPRKIFDALMKHCEAGTIDYFILNNKPMSQNPFKLTKVTAGWGAVHRFWGLKDGKVTLTLEEYAP